MLPNEEKLKKLIRISKMYYEENKTQAEIAKTFQISRPMVSRLLTEAKELGVVTIHITEATSFNGIIAEHLKQRYGIKNVWIVPMEKNEERTDKTIVATAARLLIEGLQKEGCVGIGWGSLMGKLADYLQVHGDEAKLSGSICPIIGSAAASYRSYHTNELVRIISENTGLSPSYIYAPAVAETEAEKSVYENTDSYRQVSKQWENLNVAIINVSNYPSSPDMATALRFGIKLSEEKATGHILSYFYDQQGVLIQEEKDCLLRISLEQIKRAESVVAMCSSGLKTSAVAGVLATGMITDIILSEEMASNLL